MPITADPGASLDSIERARELLHLELEDVAAIIGVNRSTLHRWTKRESTPRAIAWSRIAQLGDLLDMLPRVFSGPDLARTWLTQSHPESLGGRYTPMDVLRAGRIDRVLSLLHFLARGA
jgi:transcriptional regulator with XRE-family HTH domain